MGLILSMWNEMGYFCILTTNPSCCVSQVLCQVVIERGKLNSKASLFKMKGPDPHSAPALAAMTGYRKDT